MTRSFAPRHAAATAKKSLEMPKSQYSNAALCCAATHPQWFVHFEQRAWSYSIFFLNASPVRHSNKRRVVGFDLRQDRAERKSVPYRRHGGHSRHRPKRFRFHMPSLSPPFLCFVDIVAAPRDRTPLSIETNRRIGFGRRCFLMVNYCLVHANRKFESSHLDGGMTDSTKPHGGILE